MKMLDAYVINLDSRPDRWSQISERFKDCKTLNLIRVPGEVRPLAKLGCWYSHLKVIKMAKDKNLPFVLVMEDDCQFQNLSEFEFRLPKIIDWLVSHPNDWTVFNSGPTFVEEKHVIRIVDSDIPLVETSWGFSAHMIIYNSSIYDQLLADVDQSKVIDYFVACNFKMIVPYPFLSTQAVSYSDIEHCVVNYAPHYHLSQENINRSIKRLQIQDGINF